MNTATAFQLIEAQSDRFVEFLSRICTFETPSADKKAVDAMVDYIADFAAGLGLSVRRTPFDACGDFLTIDLNEGAPKHSVFLAHMDTVHEKGRFGYPAVRMEGDRMIGPGTIDCKGGIAVALLVLKALRESDYQQHARLILTSDEEISNVLGGEREQEFFRESVAGFRYALNCEVAERNEVVVSRKGIMRYEIEVQGRGGHAGINYFDCKNAVLESAKKIVELESHSHPERCTYSCNVIHARSVSNVIPDRCTFTVDVRVIARKDMEAADRFVREVGEKSFIGGTTARVTRLGMRPPMEKREETQQLFEALDRISQRLGYGELVAVSSGGGSDSAYTQAAGVTSLCGLGPCGEFCHTDREYVNIKTIAKRAKMLTALLCEE